VSGAACAADRHEPELDALDRQLSRLPTLEATGSLRVTIPPRANDPVVVDRGDGASVSIEAENVGDAPLQHLGDRHVARLAAMDVVRKVEGARYEEVRHVRHEADRIELSYRIVLGPAIASLRVIHDRIEALDGRGVARLRTEPAMAVDGSNTVRELSIALERTGDRVYHARWTLDAKELRAPIAIDPAWTATASLAHARHGSSAFPLPGKKVIVIGANGDDTTTEIYDDATASWTFGPSLTRTRRLVRAIQLTDGRIMLIGGIPSGPPESPPTADVYDPATGTIKKSGPLPSQFFTHGSAPLPGGGAIVVNQSATAIYDAATDTWTGIAEPATPRVAPAVAVAGKVVIAGGVDGAGVPLSSAELFDPLTKAFSALPSMTVPRKDHTLTVVGSKVVVVGGGDETDPGAAFDSVEILDVTTKTWTAGPKLKTARNAHASAAMPDGRVLVAGGIGFDSLLSSAEIVDPVSLVTVAAGALNKPRGVFPLVPIVAGESRFLAVGGYNAGVTASVEIFSPLAVGGSCTGPGECANGFCVDGVCCEKSACPSGQTCSGADPGHCHAVLGTACTSKTECASGLCVDGVCCDRACEGSCEACDLGATPGRCGTLPPGDSPHGTRAKCPGVAPCAGTCGGVDATKCTLFPGAAIACGGGTCTAGKEAPVSSCDGAGACTKSASNDCGAYACGETSCKKACKADADCAMGYSCDTGRSICVFGAKCDGDHTDIAP
jgi:hypothetical protein